MNVTLFRDLPTEHWHSMERYADELERALKKIGCDAQSFVAVRPFPQWRGRMNALANYGWRTLIYPRAARNHQGDVNHIIDHSYAHLIHGLDARRTVVTCHDLAPLALKEGRGIGRRLWNESFRAMLRAAFIIADSAFTRDAILRHSDYSTERVHVVPLAVSDSFFERVAESDLRALRERYHLSARKIILHVGSCAPRKNIETILCALKELSDHGILFLQIGGRFTGTQTRLMDELGLRERVQQIHSADENELRAWYQLADVLVLPSSYEGFGLPILEAMASGAPVVSANASSLPEAAGDAALLTDSDDAAKLADAIRAVLGDSALANDLRARGLNRAKNFSWDRTARETLLVYQQIA